MEPPTATPPIWQGSARAGWGLWSLLGVVGVLCAVVVGSDGGPVIAAVAPVVVVVLIATWFSSMHVAVSQQRVEVRSGLVAWPRIRLPLDSITSVIAEDLRPMRWGGWGYRGCIRLLERAAWILRAGPAIELQLTDGRRFAVTVDDAAEGAAGLNGLRGTGGARRTG